MVDGTHNDLEEAIDEATFRFKTRLRKNVKALSSGNKLAKNVAAKLALDYPEVEFNTFV